eukprot:GILJ01021478.1.p3 GENE.GILJ01021478.1~~GILJ01021478.1.p3  ORF type:complete len:135 (+),score=25.08 GILJ01021478.1:87-491(+)
MTTIFIFLFIFLPRRLFRVRDKFDSKTLNSLRFAEVDPWVGSPAVVAAAVVEDIPAVGILAAVAAEDSPAGTGAADTLAADNLAAGDVGDNPDCMSAAVGGSPAAGTAGTPVLRQHTDHHIAVDPSSEAFAVHL